MNTKGAHLGDSVSETWMLAQATSGSASPLSFVEVRIYVSSGDAVLVDDVVLRREP